MIRALMVLACSQLLLVGLGTALLSARRLTAELHDKLEREAQALLHRVDLRLSWIIESVRELAKDSAITNGLIDASGRSVYLPAAVRDFSRREHVTGVRIVDFTGRTLAARAKDGRELPELADPSEVLSLGRTSLTLTDDGLGLIVAAPVEYYRTPQGAVVAEIDLESLIGSLAPASADLVFWLSGQEIFRQQPMGITNAIEVQAQPDRSMAQLEDLVARMQLRVPQTSVMRPVAAALVEMAYFGAAALLLSLAAAWHLGRHLSLPIRRLSERVRAGAHPCAPTGTGDELESLASAFDAQTEALVHARAELEKRVGERTQQLADQADELERSNRELDDFAYIASHDLREPLRGMHNYAGFVLEDCGDVLSDGARQMLTRIEELAQRMDSLLDGLLTYSRLGRVDLARAPTDLQEVLSHILEDLELFIEEVGATIEVPSPLPTIDCDRVRVGEIFRNLMTNALKYTTGEDVRVRIEASSSVRDGELVFSVSDNGIGIQEEHHEKIFTIFKRLHPQGAYGGGSGAGLTIVKKMVEMHEGRIWVESKLGKGTTFFFTLGARK